jgi:TolB-like protein/tetratricopeptide (TPR) repeat protein
MPTPSNAVFLSYASEDASAAQRIADSLRAAGIEVWFDREELRGGDAWDRRIREQIHDCRLFVAVISAHTEARDEGYFRREWKLAVDRTHDMDERKAFLVPVVIDSTPERGAHVPEKFRELQWTRLPSGETSAAFVERIRRLLAPDSASARGGGHGVPPDSTVPTGATRPVTGFWRSKPMAWAIAPVLAVALAYFVLDRFWLSKRAAAATASTTVAGIPTSPALPEKSIAVLPFVDMSEKHDQGYFSDGLSEELIDLLTKVPDLRVPARTSSFFFKDKSEDIATIAQKLHVAHLLEGSVRKAGNTIRVTAQLIRADNGYHLWSETYDRELRDVFKVQDEIAGSVVSALKVKLVSGQQVSKSNRTSNPEAHDEFLIGRQFFERGNDDGFRRAAAAYTKATELDPGYAAAYAGLAFAKFWSAENADGFQQALAAADKAIELAPDEADGYTARGYLRYRVNWDWTGAQADLERALALDPSNRSQMAYSELLVTLGRAPDGIAAAKKATELDPLSHYAWSDLGLWLLESERRPAAHEALRRALEIQPESPFALSWLGELELLEGKASDALATFRKVGDEGFRLWGTAMAEHTLNHARDAQQALDELIAKHTEDFAYEVADVYAWRGEKDKAFQWLERSYDVHSADLVYIKDDVILAALRDDPRYKALLRKMNLPE